MYGGGVGVQGCLVAFSQCSGAWGEDKGGGRHNERQCYGLLQI